MSSNSLQVEWVPLDRLFGNPANPRINDPAVPHVAASIRRFGWQQPIVAQRSGEVIAGHTRLKAAHELGCEEVPVHWFHGDELDAIAYAIADNRSHEFADWDEPALAQILEQLRQEDALDGVGYTEDDIDDLLEQLQDNESSDVDDPGPPPPPEQPVTAKGDLWVLGQHRLLCGDAADPEHMARLMNGETASLLATDPPYCVEYTGDARPSGGKDWSEHYREVDIEDLGAFLRSILRTTLAHVADGSALYFWHAHLQYPIIDEVLHEFDILRHQIIVWVKPSPTLSFSVYRWSHEPCVFGWRRGHPPRTSKKGSRTTIWEVDWEGKQRIVGNEHPTQKPVRLFEIPMEQHTRRGAVVLEPFSGSGSQLIAAEKLRRRCFAMEISPAFVDVAIRRWQDATGKSAILDGTGQTFDGIAKTREK